MTSAIPVIDLAAASAPDAPQELLDQVREATETIGVIQVVNHGVRKDLISEFDQRIGRLLDLPRDRKAELASPTGHPYRGCGSGRTTSAVSSSSASTSASSTMPRRPGRRASRRTTSASTPTTTCGRPTTRNCAT
jgi:isopenicillin N synthase-like dioxygenase